VAEALYAGLPAATKEITYGVEFGAQVDNVEAGGFFAAFGRERGET
jgi:hypothetical protein